MTFAPWPPSFLALLGVGVIACAGSPRAAPAPQPATPPADAHAAHAAHAAPPLADTVAHQARRYTPADVDFMQQMIHHHAQALQMTVLVPGRTTRREIHLIAERIEVSQRDEIRQMQQWLRARGEAVPAADTMPTVSHAAHGGHTADSTHAMMPGMLTPAQMAQLAAATGAGFDRLFLELMIRHHEGALTMVSDLLARGGAQESQMFSLAAEIESDQMMEIARMQRLLATMPAPRSGDD